MAPTRHPRTWVEISASALRHNVQAIQKYTRTPIAPVIKANAYGHGLAGVSHILKSEAVWGVCVAYGSEALHLRALGWKKKILVMSYWRPAELPELAKKNIDLVIWNFASLGDVQTFSQRRRQMLKIQLKLDTGTSRIGFLPDEIEPARRIIENSRYLKLAGVFSHLANSEEAKRTRTNNQTIRFTTLTKRWEGRSGILRHLACTAAGLRYPRARFGLVRAGIGIYGLWPSEATKDEISPKISFKPVMSWKTIIGQIKVVQPGAAVGYGSTWRAQRRSIIATLPVGYSDGYDRSWSNQAWVVIRGQRAPVVGRVSMNLLTVDVTKIRYRRANDIVTLLGAGISADDLARAGTSMINYEVVTAIHPDIPRMSI